MKEKEYITIEEATKKGYTHCICSCGNPTMISLEELQKRNEKGCSHTKEVIVLEPEESHFFLEEDDMINEIQDHLEVFAEENGSNEIDWDYKRVFENKQVKEQWKLFTAAVNNAIQHPNNGVGYYKATNLHIKI